MRCAIPAVLPPRRANQRGHPRTTADFSRNVVPQYSALFLPDGPPLRPPDHDGLGPVSADRDGGVRNLNVLTTTGSAGSARAVSCRFLGASGIFHPPSKSSGRRRDQMASTPVSLRL